MVTPLDANITLLVTDRDLAVVGDEIRCWDTVDCTLRHNEVGSGQFTAPAHAWIREQLDASHRVVVIRNGQVFQAGPIEDIMIERSDDGENSGVGKVTVEFADDLSLVVARDTYPDPAVTLENQAVDYWTYNDNAETVLRDLVNLNAGPGALTARQVPQLALGAVATVGTTVSGQFRMEPLGDALRSVALAGGGLGFRTRQVGDQILFEVFAPQDLADTVRFGFGLGNLRYLAYQRTAPTVTSVAVGGQGEGADRYMIGRTNSTDEAAWGRREAMVARPGSTDVADLERDGDEALAEGAERIRLQTSAWETPDQRFGDQFGLGDRVSVQVGPGEAVSDLVRLAHLQAWGTAGELLSVMVGTQEASSDPAWLQQMRAMTRRLSRLERGTLPSS